MRLTSLVTLGVAAAIAGLMLGCAARSPDPAAPRTPVKERSGAQLWADRCASCHVLRPPDSYSDARWKVVVKHMRHQASMTGAEERAILKFLRAAN